MIRSQRWFKAILVVVMGFCLVFFTLFLLSVIWTKRATATLKSFELDSAQVFSTQARATTHWLNILTGHRSSDFQSWQTGMELVQLLAVTGQEIQSQLTDSTEINLSSLADNLPVINERLDQLAESLSQSQILPRLVGREQTTQLLAQLNQFNQAGFLLEKALTGQQTWLIVLQNSDELRAGGGFMGSYALVRIDNGKVVELKIEDIYDADGQFTGFVEPPAGAKEYLSSGKGLRLPDSNWSPDFPTTAQTSLSYFGLGNKSNLSGLIAINHPVVADILQLTGPIYLADYQTTVTSDSMSELLRSERDDFFPGSIQKKHLLSQLLTQLSIRLPEIIRDNPLALLELFKNRVEDKSIQAFSLDQNQQQSLIDLGLAGQLNPPTNGNFLMLVESNVGINKVNRFINRAVTINAMPQAIEVQVEFNNQALLNDQERNDYINYQRILVPTDWQVESLMSGNQAVETWDEEMIVSSTGQKLKQVGFLVVVPAQQSTSAQMRFSTDSSEEVNLTDQTLLINKQSGLPATPYTIISPGGQQTLILETNTQVDL